jgi:hypothetical protein
MKVQVQKNLILEQMSTDTMHAALQGRTLSAEDLHQRALMKQGKDISIISDAQHKASFAKNMYGMNSDQIEKERAHAASVRAIGL